MTNKENTEYTEDTEDEIIVDQYTEDAENAEVEPPLESYSRDYDKDEEMEKIFNQLF